MEYDQADNLSFHFGSNKIPLGSELKKILIDLKNWQHDDFPFNLRGNGDRFLSVYIELPSGLFTLVFMRNSLSIYRLHSQK